MLGETELLHELRRHWDHTGKDEDVAHEIYHDDAVLEFPQSGERFEGVENFREWRRQYPARLRFHTRRITHREDLVVVENLISYDGGPWMLTVNLLEFSGDRVAHERIYIMEPWDAAEWRAPWRAELTRLRLPLPSWLHTPLPQMPVIAPGVGDTDPHVNSVNGETQCRLEPARSLLRWPSY